MGKRLNPAPKMPRSRDHPMTVVYPARDEGMTISYPAVGCPMVFSKRSERRSEGRPRASRIAFAARLLYGTKYLGPTTCTDEQTMNDSPTKQISAIVPLIMSAGALAMVLIHAAVFGITRESDEGTPAHIFQLLMVGQLPFIAYHAVAWLPRSIAKATRVLVLQLFAASAAVAAVLFLT